MKKSKLLCAISLILCVITFLTSCGAPSKRKIMNPDYYESHVFRSVDTMTIQGTFYDSVGDLGLFIATTADVQTFTVCNLAETDSAKANVLSVTENAQTDYSVRLGNNSPFFVLIKDDKSEANADETYLYDKTGKMIVKIDKKVYPDEFADLVELDRVVYRVKKDGKITVAAKLPELGSGMPDFSRTNGKYYYVQNSKNILVYNDKCELISNYEFPEYAVSPATYVLDNGNILAQYHYQLPDDAKKFSYSNGNLKYDLVTLIINPKNGKSKRIKADYEICYHASRSVSEYSDEFDFKQVISSVKNIACVYPITDGKLTKTTSALKFYSMSDNGKLGLDMETLFPNQSGIPEIITSKYCVFESIEGKEYLASLKGKIIGEITEADDISEDYIVKDDIIYNYDLEKIYDAEAAKLSVLQVLDHCVLLEAEGGIVKLLTGTNSKNISMKDLLSKEDAAEKEIEDCDELSRYFFAVEGNETDYYNSYGEKVFTASGNIEFEKLDNVFILYIDERTSTTVYRLSEKAAK